MDGQTDRKTDRYIFFLMLIVSSFKTQKPLCFFFLSFFFSFLYFLPFFLSFFCPFNWRSAEFFVCFCWFFLFVYCLFGCCFLLDFDYPFSCFVYLLRLTRLGEVQYRCRNINQPISGGGFFTDLRDLQ